MRMRIDPVLLLSDEIRSAEGALREVTRQQDRNRRKDFSRLANLLVERVKRLNAELVVMQPTSAAGSAELLRVCADRLSFTQSRYIRRLHAVADSLSAGRCTSADLVWLRAVEVAAREGLLDSVGVGVALLLRSAITAASRPVLVSDSACLSRDNPAWRTVLSTPAA